MSRLWLACLALAASAACFAQEPRLATELIGAPVLGANGEPLGEVEELLIDPGRARVQGAVLAYGGVLGVAEKRRLVPMRNFIIHPRGLLMLPLTQEALEEDPGLVAVRRHSQFLPARALLGREVVDDDGNSRGEVDDLVISLQDGDVQLVVLEYDQARGLGSVPLSVPPGRLSIGSDDAPLVLGEEEPVEREGFVVFPSDERKSLKSE